MKSDAVDNRTVADMDELELYVFQVAGTVGLMLLRLSSLPIWNVHASRQ